MKHSSEVKYSHTDAFYPVPCKVTTSSSSSSLQKGLTLCSPWEVSTDGRFGTRGSMSASVPPTTLDPRNDSRVLIGSRIWTFRRCAALFCKMDPGALSVLNHDPKIPRHGNETTWRSGLPTLGLFYRGVHKSVMISKFSASAFHSLGSHRALAWSDAVCWVTSG